MLHVVILESQLFPHGLGFLKRNSFEDYFLIIFSAAPFTTKTCRLPAIATQHMHFSSVV